MAQATPRRSSPTANAWPALHPPQLARLPLPPPRLDPTTLPPSSRYRSSQLPTHQDEIYQLDWEEEAWFQTVRLLPLPPEVELTFSGHSCTIRADTALRSSYLLVDKARKRRMQRFVHLQLSGASTTRRPSNLYPPPQSAFSPSPRAASVTPVPMAVDAAAVVEMDAAPDLDAEIEDADANGSSRDEGEDEGSGSEDEDEDEGSGSEEEDDEEEEGSGSETSGETRGAAPNAMQVG